MRTSSNRCQSTTCFRRWLQPTRECRTSEHRQDKFRPSRGTRLNVQRVELAAVVNEALETIRPTVDAKGVQLQTVVDPRHPIVSGDPDRFQQV